MAKEVLAIDLTNQLSAAWKAKDITAALEAINAPGVTQFEALKAGIYCEQRGTPLVCGWSTWLATRLREARHRLGSLSAGPNCPRCMLPASGGFLLPSMTGMGHTRTKIGAPEHVG